MKEISIEELKQLQLDILCKVHKFCQSNEIRYSLAYGTLIGAIRHKGYIPWDDDIDIMMPRPDYERFLNSFNGTYPELVVIAPENDWSYYAPYANVCDNRTFLEERTVNHMGNTIGVKIDVFPIDGVPNDFEMYKSHDAEMKKTLKRLGYKKWRKDNYLKALENKRGFIIHMSRILSDCFISFETLQKKHYTMAIKYPYEASNFADNVVFNTSNKLLRQPKECFENYIDVTFEGFKFKAIQGYDSFLRALYGDYMKLPPADKQIPHHGFTAYWK